MQTKVKWWLSISLLCLFYGVTLLVNFNRVSPTYGYDWPGHFTYLYHVAEHGTPPPAGASAEFFNPPLYYFSVAAFQRVTGIPLGRAGQTFNLLLAVVTLAILLRLCRKVWGDDLLPALWIIGIYVFNPVIYRTFGMVRPEAMLLPLFAAAMYFVALVDVKEGRVFLWVIGSGILAGIVFGVRQWGAFLEAAFALWWLLISWPALKSPTRRWATLRTLSVQPFTFLAMVALYLLLRGESLFAFNTQPKPFDSAFLITLDLPVLFSSPVRPALDYSFWPVMYADFWGDYWRYWREALWHDPLPTSPATMAALARSMWAALPASVMMGVGLFLKSQTSTAELAVRDRVYQFARVLVIVSFAGFLVFATIYAPVGKGDTAKSVYLVYQVPFWGYLAAETILRLRQRTSPKLVWAYLLPLLLIAGFVTPNCYYLPPERMISRTWAMPTIQQTTEVTFGGGITLVGYDVTRSADSAQWDVTLVWRSDAYMRRGHKVFVHLLGADGELVAQSDVIPAAWERPTYAWMLGEYITDVHHLSVQAQVPTSDFVLNVGIYREKEGQRLLTSTGSDYVTLDLSAIFEAEEAQTD